MTSVDLQEPLVATMMRRQRRNQLLLSSGASTEDFAKMNHPPISAGLSPSVPSLAARVVSPKIGGQAGAAGASRGGLADDSLCITLALATNLTELRLRGCSRVSAASFDRMGEGRGLVALFVKQSRRRRHRAAVVNSAVCRIDAVPQSVRKNLVLGGLSDLRRGESYEYKVRASELGHEKGGSSIEDDWGQWGDDEKHRKKNMRRKSHLRVPVDILARILRSPSEKLLSAGEELARSTRGVCAYAAIWIYEKSDVLQTSQWRSIASSVPLALSCFVPLVDDELCG